MGLVPLWQSFREHSYYTQCSANQTNERTNQKTVRSLYRKVSRVGLDLENVIPASTVLMVAN